MAEPEFPLLPLQAGAVAFHENMIAFVDAGFTRAEAMQIVLTMLTESIRLSGRGPNG